MSNGVKAGILMNLKAQWKPAVIQQYKEDPEKVKNADIAKNAKEIHGHPGVRMACRISRVSISREDIEAILTEIRDEVIQETK